MSTSKPPIRLNFQEAPRAVEGALEAKKKMPSPLIGTERIQGTCGHTIVFDLYAKDPHRDGRRAKVMSRDCSACRQARVQAEVTAAVERRANRKKGPPPSSHKPRLPDGSTFAATYDATAVRWTGALTIDGATFEQSGNSLRRLLHKLDDEYRAALRSAAATSEPEPA